jgi:ketosteroid isomerase-like protein
MFSCQPRAPPSGRDVSRVTDEQAIRNLITRWAEAVHAEDLDTVVADHDPDIVMFDVPPPYDGVRGMQAYRDSWPPFFEWQRQGAVFEIVELDVTAGDDVAFAHALLRCGMPADLEANRPIGCGSPSGCASAGAAGSSRTSTIRSR